jgi:hypothetical protein
MDIINDYFNQIQEVYKYFGFKEDWVVYPLEDYREHNWKIVNDDKVVFGEKNDVISETGNHYENEIYKQRFYKKWVYRGEKYTMIFVDTHTDGNKFFGVYDNSKELT